MVHIHSSPPETSLKNKATRHSLGVARSFWATEECRILLERMVESASQFNREYRRLFGLLPLRDVERLRTTPGQSAA
jgi:hypothetical protein